MSATMTMTAREGASGVSDRLQIDAKAFEILVREHHRRTMAFALSLVNNPSVAEDLVQDGFVTAYRKLDSFDGSRDFGAWVRGIVRNKYREWARAQKEMPLEPEVLDALDRQHGIWHEAASGPGELLASLRECIGKLPDAIRQTVDAFYMEQLSGRETATRLSIEEAVVRKRLQRARKSLGLCIRQRMEVRCG